MTHEIRGRVWRSRAGTWAYEVSADGIVVLTDNTGAWDIIYRACRRSVAAVERVTWAGHKLRPWADLLEEAKPL